MRAPFLLLMRQLLTATPPADLGYNALPFLIRSELLLFPVAIFAAFYIVSLLGFNVSYFVLKHF